jgi:hypothetical protein
MAPRLRALHRAEDIGSALKRGVNVCHRQLVNEVLGPLVTEFVGNFGREGATPIQLGPNASLFGRVQAVKLMKHNALRHLMGRSNNSPISKQFPYKKMLSGCLTFCLANSANFVAARESANFFAAYANYYGTNSGALFDERVSSYRS